MCTHDIIQTQFFFKFPQMYICVLILRKLNSLIYLVCKNDVSDPQHTQIQFTLNYCLTNF